MRLLEQPVGNRAAHRTDAFRQFFERQDGEPLAMKAHGRSGHGIAKPAMPDETISCPRPAMAVDADPIEDGERLHRRTAMQAVGR